MDTTPLVIENEDDAIAILRRLVDGWEIDDISSVEFAAWPRFEITIKGNDFDGTIPTRVMPAMLDLQKEIHRVYCLTKYGDENLRRVTKEDREQLELLVRVDPGSSVYKALLKKPFAKIMADAVSRLSPSQITAIALTTALSITSVIAWKMWLNNRIELKQLDQAISLSELEKEKLAVIQQAYDRFPASQQAAEGMNSVRNDFLGRIKPADQLQIDTPDAEKAPAPVVITGERASELLYEPRETAVEKMVDGLYFLRSANFAKPEAIRAEVERVSDGYSFTASIPMGVLAPQQAEALRNDTWERKNVHLSLLVKELRGRYTTAKIVQVKAPPSE